MVLEPRGHVARPLFSKNFHFSQGRQTILKEANTDAIVSDSDVSLSLSLSHTRTRLRVRV